MTAEPVIGVVGAGAMGAGIAELAAREGCPVRLCDASPEALGRALAATRDRLRRDVEKGRLEAAAADAAMARLAPASLAEVARRHDLNANQLFTWRRQFGVEPVAPRDLAPILPVTIASEIAADDLDAGSRGQMEIVLADGERIIVWSDVETAALTRVLKALARR